MNQRSAFTMIEIVFVIVVLGILASIAISKMAATRDDAIIAKGRSEVAAIRNAIALTRNQQLLQGNPAWINKLDALSGASSDGDPLFDRNGTGTDAIRLLDYPIYARDGDGGWMKVIRGGNVQYDFQVMGVDVNFTYDPTNGSFDCDHDSGANILREEYCSLLTE